MNGDARSDLQVTAGFVTIVFCYPKLPDEPEKRLDIQVQSPSMMSNNVGVLSSLVQAYCARKPHS